MDNTKLLNLSGLARAIGGVKTSKGEVLSGKKAKLNDSRNELSAAIRGNDKTVLRRIEKALNLPHFQVFEVLLQATQKELSGRFSKKEWLALAGANNPGNIDFKPIWEVLSPSIFYEGMKAADNLEYAFSMQGIEWESIEGRLNSLNYLEVFCIRFMIHQFWNEPESYGREQVHFEDWYEHISR